MNIVVLRGRLAAVPSARRLRDGRIVWSFDLSTPSEGGTLSVPVVWDGGDEPGVWLVGAELFVVGRARRRFFHTAGGTQSRTEIVAVQVSLVARKGPTARAWRKAWSALGPDDLTTLRSGLGALPGAST
jgi:hypothetical protein